MLSNTPIMERKYPNFILALDVDAANALTNGIPFGIFPDNRMMESSDPLLHAHLSWRERTALETNDKFRHLISYVTLRYVDETTGQHRYLCYQRTKKVGEDRLAGNYSIGLGGHVELADWVNADNESTGISFHKTMLNSIDNELWEEVNVRTTCSLDFFDAMGFLCTADEKVGKYHLGIVGVVTLQADQAKAITQMNEEELLFKGWLTKEELLAGFGDGNAFEEWSRMLIVGLPSQENLSDASILEDLANLKAAGGVMVDMGGEEALVGEAEEKV